MFSDIYLNEKLFIMSKIVQLTEKDLNRIVKKVIQEQEQNEIFGGLKDVARGLKGAFQGAGYDNSKLLSSLSRTLKRLKKLDEPNIEVMNELRRLKSKVASAKFGHQDHKSFLENSIDRTIQYFEAYQNALTQIDIAVYNKII